MPDTPGEYLKMNTSAGKSRTPNALLEVIDEHSYDWLEREAPEFVSAIRTELTKGSTPDQIHLDALRHMGYQREAFAQRLLQAARHLSRTQAG